MLTLKYERDLNPPDYEDYEGCEACGKELLISNHIYCQECAEAQLLDEARDSKTLLAEIISGEYSADTDAYLDKLLYAWESNDADLAFDALLDAFSGAVRLTMEGK